MILSIRNFGLIARKAASTSRDVPRAAVGAFSHGTYVPTAARLSMSGHRLKAGEVFSWTVTHQAFHPAFAADVPYAAIVVALDEGVRMASRLINCSVEEITLDMPVKVKFERIAEDFILPCFQPVACTEK